MTPETAAAIEADLCMEDYRIQQSLLASGLPWTLAAYAQARWGLDPDQLSIVQREDVPPAFRPAYAEGGELEAWRQRIEERVANELFAGGEEWCEKLGIPDGPDDAVNAYLCEEVRRAEMASINLPADAA